MVGNTRQYIEGGYVIESGTVVRFKLNAYDKDKTVVIDPVLTYSSFLGGGVSDGGEDIAVDRAGNIYVTGFTFSPNFPTKNALQNSAGASDIFITKIDKSGSSLLYSSFIGGSGFDAVSRIAVDAAGNVYLAGGTSSTDFPVTSGAIQSKFGGGDRDAFVLKLASEGTRLEYSTYLGGAGSEKAKGLDLDTSANVYITGSTDSLNFPVRSSLQTTLKGRTDAFVAKINSNGSALVYSALFGGRLHDSGNAVAVDSSGNA